MKINTRGHLRIAMPMLSLLVVGVVCSGRVQAQAPACLSDGSCVPVTLKANVQITNLHPSAGYARIYCSAPLGNMHSGESWQQLGSSGYTGVLTAVLPVVKSDLANAANRTLNVTCELQIGTNHLGRVDKTRAAVVSTGPLQMFSADNWNIVAAGSTVSWTQTVTIPNANPVP